VLIKSNTHLKTAPQCEKTSKCGAHAAPTNDAPTVPSAIEPSGLNNNLSNTVRVCMYRFAHLLLTARQWLAD
jgi:hypothetical protein